MNTENKKSRLVRLTSILIYLQSKRIVIAKEMAEKYEVSLRTIYRDIKTLQDAGVPIGSENGLGYFLIDGYHLPPVMLTEAEVNALFVSEQLVLHQGDRSLVRDYKGLTMKIKSILRNGQKTNLAKLENRVGPLNEKETDQSNCVSAIQKAIVESRVLKIHYHSGSKDELTKREVEPMGISFTNKSWYMVAYCKLRSEMREFKLSRIEHLETLFKIFESKKDFSLSTYYAEVPNY